MLHFCGEERIQINISAYVCVVHQLGRHAAARNRKFNQQWFEQTQQKSRVGWTSADPDAQGLRRLPSSCSRACGFDPHGFKMPALPPGIKSTFQAERKRKGKGQNVLCLWGEVERNDLRRDFCTELGHMAAPSCKGVWEHEYFYLGTWLPEQNWDSLSKVDIG